MASRKKIRPISKLSVTQTAGGIPIGMTGSGAIYGGYTMVYCDDFNNKVMNLFNPSRPFGQYGSTGLYSNGARTKASPLNLSMDCDNFFTGIQDINRGTPIMTNTLYQINGGLGTQVRTANSYETPNINGRSLVAAMIHTYHSLNFTAPAIMEARVKYVNAASSTSPGGWHQTFWTINSSSGVYPSTYTPPAPGAVEFDFPEVNGANFNAHGATTGPASSGTVISTNIFDGNWHLFTTVMTATGCNMYLDGNTTPVATYAQDCTNTLRPYYLLFTGHTVNPTLSDFAALGQTGVTGLMDYYRLWLPTASATNIITPTQLLPIQQYAFGSPITYVYPSTTTLFGSLPTSDYCTTSHVEDFEPGSTVEGGLAYVQFPTFATFNSGTRTLTGTPDGPGRLYTICIPYLAGGSLDIPARGWLDIGPNITTSTLNATVGTAFSYDLYPDCNCGTLFFGKIITCTNLPSGLSFSPITNLITGTPVTNATTSITIGVTNQSGQVATKNVNLVVASGGTIALDNSSFSSSTTFNLPTNTGTATITTTSPNELIYMVIRLAGAGIASVTNITDTSSLSWARRSIGAGTNPTNNYETWYAIAPTALTGNVISVVTSGATGVRLLTMGIQNVNTTTPFDPNVSVPVSVYNASANTLTRTVSTNHANDMVIAYCGTNNGSVTYTEPSGFTGIPISGTTANDICYQVQTTTLSSKSITYSVSSGSTMNMIIDAIQGV